MKKQPAILTAILTSSALLFLMSAIFMTCFRPEPIADDAIQFVAVMQFSPVDGSKESRTVTVTKRDGSERKEVRTSYYLRYVSEDGQHRTRRTVSQARYEEFMRRQEAGKEQEPINLSIFFNESNGAFFYEHAEQTLEALRRREQGIVNRQRTLPVGFLCMGCGIILYGIVRQVRRGFLRK